MTTFLKKIFFYLSFILIISSNSYSAEPNAEAFVLKLTNEAKLIFNDKSLNVEARLKKLNNLSQSYLDLDALAGYTLGDYRDKATASEKDNFNKLFREYFIKNMSSKLNDFADQDLKIIDSKKINDNSLIYECYVNLGSSLLGLRNFQKALDYHIKALEQIESVEDKNYHSIFRAQTYNNIGFVYLSMNQFDDAIKNFSLGLKIENIKNLHLVLYTALLDNYAYSNFKNKTSSDEKDFIESLKIRDSINDVAGKVNSRIHLTEYYLSKKDTSKALQYNEEANRLAKESKYNKEVLQTLDFYTQLKPKEGLKYAKEYIKLSDSLQQQERLTRNKLARIEFETDEIIVEKEAISNRFRVILISSMLVISFGILFYIILYQRSKHRELLFSQEQQKANEEIYKLMLDKQEELEEAKKREQLRISQDLHDNILNKLAGIRFNLFALTQKPDESVIKRSIEYIDKIQSVESEIRTVAHELNFESFLNKGNYRSILEQLLQNQKETYQTNCDCTISSDEAIESLSALVKMNIYRIIQETLNNINKHANATTISLQLYVKEGFLYLSIADDGVGFNVEKSKSGIGLKNIQSRVESINGKLKISSEINKGTKVFIKVKL